jgi:flagellar M-ring protein FliF
VHLVIPEENLFADEAREPSASVLVKTKPGSTMEVGKVQAVVKLVASSVEGLEQERVTVADSKGAVLSSSNEDGATIAAGDARAVQTATFEQNLQTSVEQMLAPLVGAGKAVVRVRADLDFDKRETTTESFDTERKAPVVAEKTGTETYTGAGQTVGGVLGPENVELPEGAGTTDYDKEQAERQYAVARRPRKRSPHPAPCSGCPSRWCWTTPPTLRSPPAPSSSSSSQPPGWTPSAVTWWRSTAWRSTPPPRPRPRRSSPPWRRPPRPSSAGA